MASIPCLLIGASGLWMVGALLHWYGAIPRVAASGPANLYFIRDICSYLMLALTLLLLGERLRKRFELLFRPVQQNPQVIAVHTKFPADCVLVLFL